MTGITGAVLPLVWKFSYRKEICPFGRKKVFKIIRKSGGNFEMSKEFTRNSRNDFMRLKFHVLIDFCALYSLVSVPETF